MLDRFRSVIKRLELPPEDDKLVYRIIDDDRNAVEVTAPEYAIWRLQYDVAEKAIVGQDKVGEVMVRTTFSIMPENRAYKPFGTSVYEMPLFDPLTQYYRRYDTWRDAELGHRDTLNRITRDFAINQAAEQKAQALAGTAGEVRLALSADLPAMFKVSSHSENEVTVQTPLLKADGTSVKLEISTSGSGFVLTDASAGGTALTVGGPRAGEVEDLHRVLGVTLESGGMVYQAEDASQLGLAIIRLAQAIACFSYVGRR